MNYTTLGNSITMNEKNGDPTWSAFDITDLVTQRQESGQAWLPFLNLSTMTVGVYALPEGGVDHQEPHERDELYYIVTGKAMLQVEGDDMAVEPGSLVYVKARVDHRFHSITEDLEVLVFFSTAEPS
jgi:mannose-6-phosphate isomerase-like protein (cupin superfamily)